jgi:hypothetical protein
MGDGIFRPSALTYSVAPALYPLLGVLAGYVLVMRTNPCGSPCATNFRSSRFKRLWLIFLLALFLPVSVHHPHPVTADG